MNDNGGLPRVSPLTPEDIVPDEPLRGTGKSHVAPEQDLLHHRVIARRIAELASSASGKVNIALFGPWGSGKSSFNVLLGEELDSLDRNIGHITFDAWKNSGDGFRANFLSEVARQISPKNHLVPNQLFQATTKVSFPFGARFVSTKKRRTWSVIGLVVLLLGLFVIGPLLWAVIANAAQPVDDFIGLWWQNVQGWGAFGVSSTLLVVVLAGLLELTKVTVSRSVPSHVAQFSKLFDQLLSAGKKKRYIIFVDELDRCSPEDVVKTLEGLRTFLGENRCVFVVAFDREAVAETISTHLRHAVPKGPAAPYYGTSGEYLDKIFQFQISLPPQAAHTFRRYALSLVAAKGGIWSDLRSHKPQLLERVVTVLAPMHLASPRRTKVLLNDFAVTSRIYESLGFDWVRFAEEIAVLAVLRTEFPALMTDMERMPALMRFLYREEAPNRPELVAALARYAETPSGVEQTQLDRIVRDTDATDINGQLLVNLHRYLRRLRELRVPEPRADLIMMHSGGALVHFEDPAVYDAVLLAPDATRRDVLNELSTASESDRAQAVRHILEQAERESAQIAEHLRMVAGELSDTLAVVPPGLADALRAAMTNGLADHSAQSLRGYARAVSTDFSVQSATELLNAANDSPESLGGLVALFAETLDEEDWRTGRATLTTKALTLVLEDASALDTVLRRTGTDPNASLRDEDAKLLIKSLSVAKPVQVEPAAATAAARQEAEEANEAAIAAYEEALELAQTATEDLLSTWDHLPEKSKLRQNLLKVLRQIDGGADWYLGKHDALIEQTRESGDTETANLYLLQAIADLPGQAASRWRELLSYDAPADADAKAEALRVVVRRVTNSSNQNVRENGARNAIRIARLPSSPISAAPIEEMVRADISVEWDEYSDSRFEYQWKLLEAIDAMKDPAVNTVDLRTQLVVAAVAAAQEDDASVVEVAHATGTTDHAQAADIADALLASGLVSSETDSSRSLEVLLNVQLRVLALGGTVEPVPAARLQLVPLDATRTSLGQLWLQTKPNVENVEEVLDDVSFSINAWRVYSARADEDERARIWSSASSRAWHLSTLRAIASSGMADRVYEEAAAAVRDASNATARRTALDRYLALPPSEAVASTARGLLKAISTEGKVTQLPLGVEIIRAYARFWSPAVRSGLRPYLTTWVEGGEAYISQGNMKWLAQEGFVARKSSLFERILGRG